MKTLLVIAVLLLSGCVQENAIVWDKEGKAYAIPADYKDSDGRFVTRTPDADRNPNKCVP